MMLHHIIDAHGGKLPDDVRVVFANTGKEREETLRFVHEVGTRWGVSIDWVEWRDTPEKFERVGFNSASREGEPFAALTRKKQRLPNWMERWCTGILKVETMHAFLREQGLELGAFAEVIGLRDDEGARVLRGRAMADRDKRIVLYPMATARARKADVAEFWAAQDFQLHLQPWEGNCDLCFLKGRGIKKRILRDNPAAGDWWNKLEIERKGFFDRRDTIAQLLEEIRNSPTLFDEPDGLEYDVECGDMCGTDTPEEMAAMQRYYEAHR